MRILSVIYIIYARDTCITEAVGHNLVADMAVVLVIEIA